MNSKIVRIVIWGSVAVAVVVVLYIKYSRMQADQVFTEANARIDEGEAERKEVDAEAAPLLRGTLPRQSASDRAKLEKSVAKCNDLYTKIVVNFRSAAAKFDEASKADKTGAKSKYLDLMSQAYQKYADSEEAFRKSILLLVDKSIQSDEDLQKKRNALIAESFKLNREFEDLDFQAHDLHGDSKSKPR